MKSSILQQLLADRDTKTPVVLVTDLDSGAQYLVYEDRVLGAESNHTLDHAVCSAARQALADDHSGRLAITSTPWFAQVFNPPLRLIIVGAVHITQALVPMARLAGYTVIVVDPRQAWTTDTRFPDVELSEDWPDDALHKLAPDRRTAIVTLSHDPKLDDPALQIALRSEAFYIGSLGSKRTHTARLQRLHEAGLDETITSRIHAPIGLSIQAQSPAEIAIAIMAEITQTLRRVQA